MHFTSAIHCIICTLHILLSLPLFQAAALLLTHFANCAYSCTCVCVCVRDTERERESASLHWNVLVCNAYTCSHQPNAANSFSAASKLEIFYFLGILHILFANRWVIIHLPSSSLYAQCQRIKKGREWIKEQTNRTKEGCCSSNSSARTTTLYTNNHCTPNSAVDFIETKTLHRLRSFAYMVTGSKRTNEQKTKSNKKNREIFTAVVELVVYVCLHLSHWLRLFSVRLMFDNKYIVA